MSQEKTGSLSPHDALLETPHQELLENASGDRRELNTQEALNKRLQELDIKFSTEGLETDRKILTQIRAEIQTAINNTKAAYE